MVHATKYACIPLALFIAMGGCDALRSGDAKHETVSRQARKDHSSVVAAPQLSREAYAHIQENGFFSVANAPLSTFAVDVDTASYSNVRRFLNDGSPPPADAVRVEELINYFEYDYPQPKGAAPFSVTTEVSDCPWASGHRLVHIGLQGKKLAAADLPPRNLVFLLDVSGSMNDADKLPLLKTAMRMLVTQLDDRDRVSIVVYAGATGVVLEPTRGTDEEAILAALERLEAGGSTNGGAGIEAAYTLARTTFIQGGINRVILATDGDFNVGTSSEGELVRLIEGQRKSGVFLSVLGFGTGNLQDSKMEQLADHGNGNYAYIDSIHEARKVLVEQAGSTLVTIAKDVKMQVEFNPQRVASYRLVGYENRRLDARDFADDSKDAGEIGAGHTVTALYEVVPTATGSNPAGIPLKYQGKRPTTEAAKRSELMNVELRYKPPTGNESTETTLAVEDSDVALADTSNAFRFSAAVASFAMLLRNSEHKGSATWTSVRTQASGAVGPDPRGYRKEFLTLVHKAAQLAERGGPRTGA